jgi:glycosyltransferase involved in cell wall biosynthesis
MLHALLRSLASAGHDVTAYITDTIKQNTVIDGVNVIYGVRPDVVLETVQSDVVMSQFQNGAFAMDHAKRRRKPFIYIAHNNMWQTSKIIRLLATRDLVVFNTNWIKHFNRTQAHQVVVHPPVDCKAFKTKTTKEYITLVNLTPAKGVDIFMQLAKLFPDHKFLGVKGGYWKAEQVNIDMPNVTIIENTPNMRDDVYARSKIVLMPSNYETYGMVATEAIASGIPVIATPTAGLKENLGDAGVYARRGSNEMTRWQEALGRLLTNQAYYDEISKKSIARSKFVNTQDELKEFNKQVEGLICSQ